MQLGIGIGDFDSGGFLGGLWPLYDAAVLMITLPCDGLKGREGTSVPILDIVSGPTALIIVILAGLLEYW